MTGPRDRLIGTALLFGLLMGTQALAASEYPFARHGTINQIDANERTMVVNDVTYRLAPSMRVQLFDRRTTPGAEQQDGQASGPNLTLRKGMLIGFNVKDEGPGKKGQIVEAWVLPQHSMKPSRE